MSTGLQEGILRARENCERGKLRAAQLDKERQTEQSRRLRQMSFRTLVVLMTLMPPATGFASKEIKEILNDKNTIGGHMYHQFTSKM